MRTVEFEAYAPMEALARQRLARCDFFGCGVATWTTDRVELFLVKVITEAT